MDPPADRHDKASWRKLARRERARLDRAAWSAELVDTLRAWPRYRTAETVLTYLAFGSEADLSALTTDAKYFVVPRIVPGPGRLALHALGGDTVRHPLGMLEPTADAPRVDPADVDLALLPGLAFDESGGRLGYGAGYYDRLLPGLRAGVPRLGVSHPALTVAALPLQAHDVRVSHLLLPGRIREATEGGARPRPLFSP